MAKLFQLIALLFLVTFINGLPVDETPSGQFVVDIPAGKTSESKETKVEEPTQFKVEDSAEVVPVNSPSSSEEDGGHRITSISDLFNIRVPFSPMFVYRRPVIRDPFDTSYPTYPNYRPFSTVEREPNGYDVMSHMEAMMKRMQQQMTSLWSLFTPQYQPRPQVHRRPFFPFGYDFDRDNETETESGVDTIHIDNLPSNYSNSTSETKVIDGQLVQVNKTIHKISNNDSSSFFQVQVIKIRPQNTRKPTLIGAEEAEGTGDIHQQTAETSPQQEKETSNVIPSVAATPGSSTTTTAMNKEDPKMNEIDSPAAQRPESRDLSAEPFPYLLNRFKGQYDVDSGETNVKQQPEGAGADAVYEIVPLQQRRMERMSNSGADLSGDIRVNRILDEQNRKAQIKMVHPDVELIDI